MFWRRVVCEARRRVPVARHPTRDKTPTFLRAPTICVPDPLYPSAARWSSSWSAWTHRRADSAPSSPSGKVDAFLSLVCEGTSETLSARILYSCSPILKRLTSGTAGRRRIVLALFDALAREGDLSILDRALHASQDLFEVRVDEELHNTILAGLQYIGHLKQASRWLREMPRKPGARVASTEQWNNFLETCLTREQYRLIWAVMRSIQDAQTVKPDSRTYSLFFQAIFFLNRQSPPSISFVRSSLDRMKEHGIPFSDDLLQILVKGYNDSNAQNTARLVERIHAETQGKKSSKSSPPDQMAYTKKLSTLFAESGEKSAHRELKRMLSFGFKPTAQTLDSIAPYLSNARVLLNWEGLLGVSASHSAWSSVLRNAVEADSTNVALTAYRTFLERKHIPSAAHILPVLTALCSGSMRQPTDKDIRQAIELFREYIQLVTSDAAPDPSPQDDLPAYNILLRALCSSSNPEFYPTAVSLLEEIQARGIVMDNLTTRSFIILFIRVAPDADAAYSIYRQLYKFPDGRSALDASGFEAVLDTFCQISLSGALSSALYLSIVRDMRLAGYAITPAIYTILLRRLSVLVWRARGNATLTEELALTIRRVHNAITVDASITPDTALWNQLMDTYQRAGCFREAYNVWESLYISRQFDNASISVVLDACSHAGAEELATDVFAKVHASGFKLNQRNWANWVECLCRLGKIDEATKVLCVAMPQEKGKGVHPTKDVAQIILTFAAALGREAEIRERIKDYLPKLLH